MDNPLLSLIFWCQTLLKMRQKYCGISTAIHARCFMLANYAKYPFLEIIFRIGIFNILKRPAFFHLGYFRSLISQNWGGEARRISQNGHLFLKNGILRRVAPAVSSGDPRRPLHGRIENLFFGHRDCTEPSHFHMTVFVA